MTLSWHSEVLLWRRRANPRHPDRRRAVTAGWRGPGGRGVPSLDDPRGSGWVAATGAELVEVAAAGARVTVDPVRAVWSVPAYRAAAATASRTGRQHEHRDTAATCPSLPRQFDLVDTGDLMPDGRDAVIMREHVGHLDNGAVEIDNSVAPGRHVRAIGEDIQGGRVLLPLVDRIRPVDMAALAAAGHRYVQVRPRPVVAILATGDEVRSVGSVLAPGEVLDTNSLMLVGMAEEAGSKALRLPIAPDQPDELAQAAVAAAHHADVVLVIAGSSAGRDDHTAAVVRRLGLVAVHGVAIRPGHPVLLGVLSGQRPVPVVGVPGYPASPNARSRASCCPCSVSCSGREYSGSGVRPATGCQPGWPAR